MRRLSACLAAVWLPLSQPLLVGSVAAGATVLAVQAPGHAQSAEAVGKIATAITVRIEGATQGSGVLVKREGNRYTVLTAWHVVADQKPGEELDLYTPDGMRHPVEPGSIRRLGEVDLAVLTFTSPSSYEIARLGDVKSVSSGSSIYVSGFPLATSAVPSRIARFLKGDVIANATVAIANGYQLLYSNPTLPGMSGGAVLNAQGQLIGIHGQGETDSQMSDQQGIAVKTGTNQAVPIAFYQQYASGESVVTASSQAATADDYLAQAKVLLGKMGSEQAVIRLASQVLATSQSAIAYSYRAIAKYFLGENRGAIADCNQAIAINPKYALVYYIRAAAKHDLGDKRGAIADCDQAIAIDPSDVPAYFIRAVAKYDLGDMWGAIADYNQVIAIDPGDASVYGNRAVAKYDLGDMRDACRDYKKAVSLGERSISQWLMSDRGSWCRKMP